jgi:hypothetical protein
MSVFNVGHSDSCNEDGQKRCEGSIGSVLYYVVHYVVHRSPELVIW